MRFFTPQLYAAVQDHDRLDELRAAGEAYRRHLLRIGLPDFLAGIADAFLVDDALVAKLRQADEPPSLELSLRRGNLQIGYSDLCIDYENPDIRDEDLKRLLLVASNARSQTLYGMTDAWCHEFDRLPDGRFEHSIIFHGVRGPFPVTVRCTGLRVAQTPRSSRKLPPYIHRFRVQRFRASSNPNLEPWQ